MHTYMDVAYCSRASTRAEGKSELADPPKSVVRTGDAKTSLNQQAWCESKRQTRALCPARTMRGGGSVLCGSKRLQLLCCRGMAAHAARSEDF